MNDSERYLEKDTLCYSSVSTTPLLKITEVEGVKEQGQLDVRKMLVGDNILMLHVFRGKGLIDPIHTHMDHESMAYLISGRLHLKIGDTEFIAEAGHAWMHPIGVPHWSEALEECEQIEIKSPPKKTWKSE